MCAQLLDCEVDEAANLGRAMPSLAVDDVHRPGLFLELFQQQAQLAALELPGHLVGQQPRNPQSADCGIQRGVMRTPMASSPWPNCHSTRGDTALEETTVCCSRSAGCAGVPRASR
jgi:hypothetical protein